MDLLQELSARNYPLYLFGWISLLGAITCGIMAIFSPTEVHGISAWLKPTKFFTSTVIFVWSMGWYLGYLKQTPIISVYTWLTIAVLAFELIYITLRASQGQLSHFNTSSSYNGFMFSMMGLAISIMTLATLYIGIRFFTEPLPDLSTSYVWGIRLGIILFVIFAFEGGLMGARLSHTIGAADGTPGLKFLNWSVTHGDLRIAHFVGMHALQVLPLLGYYVLSSTKGIVMVSMLYLLLATGVLVQALMGKPLIQRKPSANQVHNVYASPNKLKPRI